MNHPWVFGAEALGVSIAERWFVRDLDLNVRRGDLVAVAGHNGSGKTTLLRTILGLRDCQAGHISRMTPWQLGRNIGYLPQHSQNTLLPWFTAGENMLMGVLNGPIRPLTSDLEALVAALVGVRGGSAPPVVSLAGVASLFGGCAVDSLSGGERQKVAILRMLLPLPEVLVLDEPYRELDYGSAVALRDYLTRFVSGGFGTVVMVSHQEVGPDPTVRVVLRGA